MKAGSVASDSGFPDAVEKSEQRLVEDGADEQGEGDVARPMGTGVDAGPSHEDGNWEQPPSDGRGESVGYPGEGDHVEGVRRGERSAFGGAVLSGGGRRFNGGGQEDALQGAAGVVEGEGAHVCLGFVGARALGDAFERVGDGVVVEEDDGDGEKQPDSSTGSSERGGEEGRDSENGFPD